MTQAWPVVKLGEVLQHRKEFITIDDLTNYKRPRVQLHVQGIVLRDEIPGALIKTKTQQLCGTGEFLVAEIDAKVGGFGIVPKSLNGSIVSSHYFLFVIDEAKLNRSFLDFFTRTPAFREQVAAQGSTNYAAIRPTHVLGYEMPLPPLAEQGRIVARIEQLVAQIHEARSLRQQAGEGAEALRVSAHAKALSSSAGQGSVHLPELGQKVRRGVEAPTVFNKVAARWSLPPGWRCISIAELLLCGALVDVKDGNHGSNHPRSTEFVDEGTPFLMASDIQEGSVNWDKASRLGEETLSRLRVGFSRASDVLFTHQSQHRKNCNR